MGAEHSKPMHFTRILSRELRPALRGIGGKGRSFEDNFVIPKPKKPWDGQDKDKYFRDKFAHVHAAQKKARQDKRKVKSEGREARSFTKNKLKRHDLAIEEGRRPKREPNILLDKFKKDQPKSFAMLFKESLESDPNRVFLYGTNSVTAALESKKRELLKVHTKHSPETLDAGIRKLCQSDTPVPIVFDVPLMDLNVMTNNGVHNNVVLETRPLTPQSITALGHVDVEGATCQLSIHGQSQLLETAYQKSDKKRFPLALFLDEITDVHNVGAILRSAYYLGVDYVIRAKRNCAELNPVVSKSSAGALEYIDIYDANHPLQFFESTASNGWNIVSAAAPSSSKSLAVENVTPSKLHELLQEKPCMLVVGSEGKGLRTSLLQRSTHVTSLQSVGHTHDVDSLNVSVATALLLARFYAPNAFD